MRSTRAFSILILLIAAWPATGPAQTSGGLMVLPYLLEGDPERAGFTLPDAPIRLQEATRFLLSQRRGRTVVSETISRRVEAALNFRPEEPFTARRAGELCAESRAEFLFAGSARFVSPTQIFLRASLYSCSGRSVTRRGSAMTTAARLQRGLLALTDETTSGVMQPAPIEDGEGLRPAQPLDLAVVVDYSGSMIFDIPAIHAALGALRNALPPRSRLGVIAIESGDRVDILPFSERWDPLLRAMQQKGARGEVTLRGLENALAVADRFREWRTDRALLVFSDANVRGRRASSVESLLRRLQNKGVRSSLFSLANQSYEDRREWERIARALRLADPAVVYGRQFGLLTGQNLFVTLRGSRFYLANEDVRSAVVAGRVNVQQLEPIDTVHFRRDELNLNDLPAAYARQKNTRLTSLGPVFSSLEKRIGEAAITRVYEGGEYASVLLKNEGLSFTIRVSEARVLERFRQLGGRKVYVGLRLQPSPDGERAVNFPGSVYIMEQGETPRLLVTTWAEVLRRPDTALDRNEVWFFLVETLEVGDARQSEDLRE
jgi:hypothetical protein